MRPTARETLDGFLLQVVDAGLACVVFVVPMSMGGRHALGQLVLTILAVAVAWAWAARMTLCPRIAWRPTWAVALLVAGAAILAIQIIPLPPGALEWLSPQAAQLLPLWNGAAPGGFGAWPYVSLVPAETRAGLVLFLDFALLFLVVVQRIERIEDVERLLRWCAISAICMAVFGIVQLLAGNGKFFWFHEHPQTTTARVAKGAFSNRNHFAQFLALGVGPLLWWLQDASRRRRTNADRRAAASHSRGGESEAYLLTLSLGVVLFAGLLSLSRGGIAALAVAAAVATAMLYWSGSVSRRFVASLAAVGLLIVASLAIFGAQRVGARLDDFSSGSIERLDREAGRRSIWAAALNAIPRAPLLGTGVGSFSDVYPIHTDDLPDDGIEYTHAENSYLQEGVELGLVGLGLTFTGIGLCGFWCIAGVRPSNPTRFRACAAAIAASLAASAAHACVDFVWYVPACMAIVSILAACALRVKQLDRTAHAAGVVARAARASSPVPRPSPRGALPWFAISVGLAFLGIWMVANRVGPALAQPSWDEYQRSRLAAQASSDPVASLSDVATQRRWIACLENVVRWQPDHARAHLALAESHLWLFRQLQTTGENSMSLTDVREAAVASRFPSRDALVAWLSRAVGDHWAHLDSALRHTRRAVALAPLQGRAYVYLADLSFLVGGDAATHKRLLDQALRVRPYDGAVLYAHGAAARRANDLDGWLDYTKRAFRSGRRQQMQILGDLVASTPPADLPEMITFILDQFEPDFDAMRFLLDVSSRRCSAPHLTPLTRAAAGRAERDARALTGSAAALRWLEARLFHMRLGNSGDALRCARRAVECDSSRYDAHFGLAASLMGENAFAEAETELRWCLQRTPDNASLQARLREAAKRRLDIAPRTADAEHSLPR